MSKAIKFTGWKLAVMVAGGLTAAGLGAYGLHLRGALQQEQERVAQELAERQGELSRQMTGIEAQRIEKRRKELDTLNAQRAQTDVSEAVKTALGASWTVQPVAGDSPPPEGRGQSLLALRAARLPVAAWPEIVSALQRLEAVRPGCGVYSVQIKTGGAYPERSFEEILVSFGQDFFPSTTSRTP